MKAVKKGASPATFRNGGKKRIEILTPFEKNLTGSIIRRIYVSHFGEMKTWKGLPMLDKFQIVAKALSDSNRIRALAAARQGDLCACQIIELLGLAPSTVSKHMALLKKAGFIESRKEGKWVYYHLSVNEKNPVIQTAAAWVFITLENDRTIKEDQKKLKRIRKVTPLELCRKQKGCLQKKSCRAK